MRAVDYLEYSITNKLYYNRSWFIGLLAVTRPKVEDPSLYKHGQLIYRPWGCEMVSKDGELIKIKDAKPNQALFNLKDKITVKSTWVKNLSKDTESTLSRLLFNLIAISEVVGDRIPYINERTSVRKVERMYASKLESMPKEGEKRDPSRIYIDELLKFGQAIEFLSSLSSVVTIAATPTNLMPPTGIAEFKASLNEKYKGRLHDPVAVADYEKELMEFDKAYLEGDPSLGYFASGKILHTSRKKLFLNVGVEQGFETSSEVQPIIKSLSEGIDKDPINYSNSMNGLRYGSYSRGAETVDGGVSAKTLLRAANDLVIEDTDCGTRLGIPRRYTKGNVQRLVNRYLITKEGVSLVKNITEALNYVDKDVLVRSPMFCTLNGERRCRVCAGERLNRYATGLAVPLTNVSSGIILASLKKMHSNTLNTAKLDLKTVIT